MGGEGAASRPPLQEAVYAPNGGGEKGAAPAHFQADAGRGGVGLTSPPPPPSPAHAARGARPARTRPRLQPSPAQPHRRIGPPNPGPPAPSGPPREANPPDKGGNSPGEHIEAQMAVGGPTIPTKRDLNSPGSPLNKKWERGDRCQNLHRGYMNVHITLQK